MSINLTDGMSTSGGMSMSPQIFSGSMEFTSGQYLQLSSVSTQFNLVGDFTIEAWIYPIGIPSAFGIFQAGPDNSIGPWSLFIANYPSFPVIAFKAGSYFDYLGTNAVPYNVWSHIAVVRSGGVLTYYLNGEVDTVFSSFGTAPLIPSTATAFVGTTEGIFSTIGNISNLRIVKGVAVYTSAFTPSTSPLTVTQPANFNGSPSAAITDNQTILLLNSDDNGFNFLDRSQNNFTLIGPDMPLPSNLSPFIGSLSFNGTSDYLTVASNTVLGFGTGDFTVECWVNWSSLTTSSIIDNQSSGGFCLYYDAGVYASNYLVVSNRIVNQLTYSWIPSLNTWYHIAIARSGTTIRMFINGVLVTSAIGDTTDYQTGVYNIGSDQGAGGWYLNGNLSNLRVVKGVAVYTSNFFPPSNVLTSVQGPNVNGLPSSAISSTQTSLLLTTPNNNNSYLVDSSIYQNIVVGPLMPAPSSVVPITDGNFDGSILFNGSSDYLTVDSSPEFTFGSGDFTIEAWVYTTASGVTQGIISKVYNIGTSAGAFLLYINASNIPTLLSCANEGGSGWTIGIGITTVTTNTWNHIAATRNGNVFTIWVNGVLSDTVTSSFILSDNPGVPVAIGSADYLGNPSFLFHGNISNMRVTKGVAVYTTDFTPSRQSLTSTQSLNINGIPSAAISGTETSLLLNTPNDVNYLVDSSSYNFTVTPIGSPTASSSIPTVAVANGSSLFNGTSDYLTVADNAAFAFGTGDFTIETWVYFPTVPSNNGFWQLAGSYWPGIAGLAVGYNAGDWTVYYANTSSGVFGSAGMVANTWIHVALVRNSNALTLYINGTGYLVTSSDTTDYNFTTNLAIGGYYSTSYLMTGYISNLRIVNGIAVYTANFTLPTSPLTATQTANTNGNPSAAITGTETSLLLNTFNSGLNRVDSSSYNFLVTSPNTPAPDNSAPSFVSEGSFLSNGYQYLQIPHSSYGNLFDQDGAFTIECWFYQTSHNPYGTFVWCNDVNSGYTWRCFYANGYFGCTGPGGSITSAPIFDQLNTWYHIALSSDGTTIRLFVNGTFQGSYAGTGVALTQDIPFQVAWGNYNGPYSYGIYGNISNFRFVKGVAVYTTEFTPPSNDLTVTQDANQNGNPSAAITGSQTSLLLNTTNNVLNHLDSSTHQLLVTTPPTPIPAAWNPYNLGSILFHDGCYLQTNSNVFNFDTNDFTIETWAYWATAKTGNETIFEGTGPTRLIFGISATGVRLFTDSTENGCTYSFAVDTWYHIAVVRLGGNISIYVNGTLANTPFVDSKVWAFTVETIGRNNDGNEIYYGNISNLRITNGVGVYTGNFTTPTKPLNVSQNAGANINPVTPHQTSLLLNTIDSPNNLLDSSIYNLTLSIAGTPTAVINNPFGPL
jgi:Concanavalin A-like lectin/glucanases superfamily